ncbi:MAG: HDOD domain-containing protein, partial [Burkholderiales bacterium]|nr:HDOD domain-containing protein [Burkholderiales bacterium]
MGWLQRLFGDKSAKPTEEDDTPATAPPAAVAPIAPAAAKSVVPAPATTPAPNAASTPASAPSAANATSASSAGNASNASNANKDVAYGATWEQRNDANANFYDWLFDNNESSEFETTPIENEILEALDKLVKGKQSGANLVKRLPGVIPQLLQSLRTENFSGAELSRKISHDVVLVAAVIRIANSSMYNPTQTITSIEHAVLILGQNGLRQLITGVAFRPIIDLNSGHYTK